MQIRQLLADSNNLDYHSYSKKQNNVIEYIHKLGGERKYSEEGIHFWKDGKLIHEVSLFIASDDEKGAIICTFDNLKIFRKDEAKFQVQKKGRFYGLRDMNEHFKYREMYGIYWFRNWNEE